jgi:MYXO-CTERM domain-containing protein
MNIRATSTLTLAAMTTACLALASAAQAQTFNFIENFEAFAPNATITSIPTASTLGLAVAPASFGPLLDGFGDPIPGTDAWRADSTLPALTVENPLAYGRGNAPSGLLALNAIFQPTLLVFSEPVDLTAFSLTLDNDTFGDNGLLPGNQAIAIQFLDANGALITSVPLNQTQPGFVGSIGAVAGVYSVYIPAGAFYDDVRVSGTVIPTPAAAGVLALGGLTGLRRRRR